MGSAWDFEGLVARYYQPLYQFAFSLTRAEADACDLTQQTFYVVSAGELRPGLSLLSLVRLHARECSWED